VVESTGPALLDPELRVSVLRGYQKLDRTEWVKIKGIPKDWKPGSKAIRGIVESMGAQEWSALGDFIVCLNLSRGPVGVQPDLPDLPSASPSPSGEASEGHAALDEWGWEPPDLGPESDFYRRQGALLRKVVAELDGPAKWIAAGEIILEGHRNNYGPGGPKHLVVLWWKWPREHWTELREGVSMNFLREPVPGIVENSAMTAEQLETATNFVDELIDLGVLQIPTEPLQNSFPLFLVEKLIKGQWRCIADGKSGGQNDNCSSNPVHLGTPDDILPFLYTGGVSAVMDISKFFSYVPGRPFRKEIYGFGPSQDWRALLLCHLPDGDS
jgi:hypothetical protein